MSYKIYNGVGSFETANNIPAPDAPICPICQEQWGFITVDFTEDEYRFTSKCDKNCSRLIYIVSKKHL